nr:somatostatin-like [Pogona vitticeps]
MEDFLNGIRMTLMPRCGSLDITLLSSKLDVSFFFFSPPKELAKYFLAELLSDPSQPENEALESDDLSRGAEQDEVRLELERSASLNPALAPRERKAGCKNFFWKTFTSC